MSVRPGTLAKSAAAVFVTAGLGGLASRPSESDWYAKLRKPWFQPPRQVFPIVWPLLYADIAAVSASAMDQLEDRHPDREQCRPDSTSSRGEIQPRCAAGGLPAVVCVRDASVHPNLDVEPLMAALVVTLPNG